MRENEMKNEKTVDQTWVDSNGFDIRRKGSSMSRKDFEVIAGVINTLRVQEQLLGNITAQNVAIQFAGELKETNPRFDAVKFFSAAGFTDPAKTQN